DVVSCADASRGADACAAGLEPDLLLVDLHLLGREGFELARSLHRQRAGLLVVALCGSDTAPGFLQAARRLRWKILMKPLLLNDFLSTICSLLDSAPKTVALEGLRRTPVDRKLGWRT